MTGTANVVSDVALDGRDHGNLRRIIAVYFCLRAEAEMGPE